jgi:hypothetical protein
MVHWEVGDPVALTAPVDMRGRQGIWVPGITYRDQLKAALP